jgi:ArsR family transcriptional regulator, virulence genes transcriptional regulator
MATQRRRARAGRIDLAAMEGQARRAAEFLRSIASEHRLMILCALAEEERSVGDLARLLGIAQPNASQHLFKLKSEGLVAARRAGQTIYYRLASRHVQPIIGHLHAMFCKD